MVRCIPRTAIPILFLCLSGCGSSAGTNLLPSLPKDPDEAYRWVAGEWTAQPNDGSVEHPSRLRQYLRLDAQGGITWCLAPSDATSWDSCNRGGQYQILRRRLAGSSVEHLIITGRQGTGKLFFIISGEHIVSATTEGDDGEFVSTARYHRGYQHPQLERP